MTGLTLIQGDEQRTFKEHPTETLRRAALAAAEVETGELASLLRRLASSLPDRTPKPLSPREQEWERKREAEREAKESWRRLSPVARESLLLQVLGDERLIIRELTARLNADLGHPTKPYALYDSHARSLVMRMFGAAQLEREAETFNQTHTRYRYSRKPGPDGSKAVA